MSCRIKYFDSMRGFAMVLVVIGHVMNLGFKIDDNIYVQLLNHNLQIPLFFFISGFFSDLSKKEYKTPKLLKHLLYKIPVLILAPFAFMSVFCLINDRPIVHAFYNEYKLGWWFTISLWEFIAAYYLIEILLSRIYLRPILKSAILFLTAIASLYLGTYAIKIGSETICLIGLTHIQSFAFFILGILVHRYYGPAIKCLNSSMLIGGRFVVN